MMKFRMTSVACGLSLIGSAAVAGGQPLPVRGEGRVLVMPFEGAGHDSRLYWLAEASAVLLAEDLGALGVDALTRDERLAAFDALQVPVRASLSHATIIRIGELVGATDIVLGSLSLEGDRLTVRARSVRLDAGRMRPEVSEHGALTDLFTIFDRVARQIADATTQAAAHSVQAHAPLPAFENFIKGLLAETPAAAIRFFDASLAVDPKYDAARLALWQVYTSQDEHAKALAAVTAVSDRAASARRARFFAAVSQLRLKQYEEAFRRFKALADDLPAPEIANNLGVILMRRGSVSPRDRATAYFSQAAAAERRDPDFAFNLGYAHLVEKNAPEAISSLRETVRLNPADSDAHFVLGLALGATGAAIESERELELASRLSSKYGGVDKRAPGSADQVPLGLERLRDDLDHGHPSLVELTVAPAELREQRELAAFHLDRGRRLYDDEHDREAIVELRRSLYLSPYQAAAHLLLARVHLRGGRARDAVDAATISIWCEDSASGHVVLGEAYLLAKDPPMARTEAQRALALDPTSGEARKLLEKLPPGGPSPHYSRTLRVRS